MLNRGRTTLLAASLLTLGLAHGAVLTFEPPGFPDGAQATSRLLLPVVEPGFAFISSATAAGGVQSLRLAPRGWAAASYAVPLFLGRSGVVTVTYDIRTAQGVPADYNFSTFGSSWIRADAAFTDNLWCGIHFDLENWQTSQPPAADDFKVVFGSYYGSISEVVAFFTPATWYRCEMVFDFPGNHLTFRVRHANGDLLAERTYDNVLGDYDLNYLELVGSHSGTVHYDNVTAPRFPAPAPGTRLGFTKPDTREIGYHDTEQGALKAWHKLVNYPAGWAPTGVGDFTTDGEDDIVIRRLSDQQLGAYLVRGGVVTGWLSLPRVPAGWVCVGFGDLDGDGFDDMVLARLSDYQVGAYLLNGGKILGWKSVGRVNLDWLINDFEDIDGDGMLDMVITNETTRVFGCYLLNKGTIAGWRKIGTVASGWTPRMLGQMDGQGTGDLTLVRDADGKIGCYTLTGAGISGWRTIGSSPAGWTYLGTAHP